MADYEINAEIKADSKGFTNGIEKAQKSTKSFSSSLTKTLKSVTGLYLGLAGATKVVKDTIKYINESTEAYKAEALSLKALETAVNNNPFTNGESIQGLKDFASEIQRTTNYGDDYLFPFMQQLISSGRTQAETMKIIKVATDIASSGAMSFETAIQQLNATMNGNIGRLGQQNAELKSLTEEELRNGKAVEILGEKYKGLAEATVDSRKQLENAKGDLKEAIGQLTAPTADKWNKFWQSFYEEGINTINRLDARKIAQPLTEAIEKAFRDSFTTSKAIGVLGSMAYSQISENDMAVGYATIAKRIRDLTDAELEAVKVWIEGLKEVNDAQKTILEVASEELNRREEINKRREEESEKANALAKAEADRLAQEERDAEKVSKAKQTLLEMEQANKEKFHEVDVKNAQAQADLRRQELEDEQEMQKAINAIDNAETLEEKIEATRKAISVAKELGIETDELEKKLARLMTLKVIKTAVSTFGNLIKGVLNGFKTGVETAINVIKKGISTITNIVKEGINVVKKLIEFNPDEALDTLLEIEDAILTFFVITLPQLPKFVESAFNSVLFLVNTLFNSLDFDKISETLDGMVDTLITYVPQIAEKLIPLISNLLQTVMNVITEKSPGIINALGSIFFNTLEQLPDILISLITMIGTVLSNLGKYIADNQERLTNDLTNIIQSIIDGIKTFIKNGGWRNILDAILAIQEAIEDVVAENLPEIVDVIIEMLPDLVETLKNSIVSASETLGKLAPPLIKAIVAIIGAILDVITSDEVIDASVEAIEGIIEALVSELLPKLPKFILKIINFLLIKLPSYTPKLVVGIIKGLIKGFAETDWKQVVVDIFEAFVDGIKDFFGIHSPSTLFQELGGFMVEGLQIGLQGIADILGNVLSVFSDVINGILDGIGKLTSISFDGIVASTNSVFNGLSKITNISFDGLTKLTNTSFSGINSSVQTLADAFVKVNDSITKSLNTLKDFIKVLTSFGDSKSGDYGFGDFAKDWLVPFGFLFAKGTNNAPSGLALVGEQGPELIDLHGGERIYTAQNTKAILSGASGNSGNTMNVTFNNLKDTTASAMMSQLRYYNRQLAVNGF